VFGSNAILISMRTWYLPINIVTEYDKTKKPKEIASKKRSCIPWTFEIK
jgi:uncharacterized protein VirK/YbjX